MSEDIINKTTKTTTITVPPDGIFTSMAACTNGTGTPRAILKRAKHRNAPGFCSNNKILWNQLKPWLEANKELLNKSIKDVNDIDADAEDLQFFKKEIAKRDVVLKDLAIKKAKQEALDPTEVKDFLGKLAILLSSVLKKKQLELVSKCTGYEAVISLEFDEIFLLIQKELIAFKAKK
jgi:hypothetical protein